MSAAEVVISGIGIVSPLGEGRQAHWGRMLACDSAVGSLTANPRDPLPVFAGARFADFALLPYLADRKMARLLSTAAGYGFAATSLALKDAGERAYLDLTHVAGARRGLYCQTGMFQVEGKDLAPIVEHCCENGTLSLAKFGERGMSVINPFLPIKTLPNMGLGTISIAFDMQGPNLVAGPFSTQGAMLLDLARAALLAGNADLCVVVGGDAPFNMMTLSSLLALDMLDRREVAHSGLFDPANAGAILGEGGVALVLERVETVHARGGRAYATVEQPAFAAEAQLRHGYPTATAAMAHVVARATAKRPVELVFAEGAGVGATDRAEQTVLRESHSEAPLASAKPQVGTWIGAGFLLETAHGALAIDEGSVPTALLADGQKQRGWPAVHRALIHGIDLAGAAAAVALVTSS